MQSFTVEEICPTTAQARKAKIQKASRERNCRGRIELLNRFGRVKRGKNLYTRAGTNLI